MRPQDEPIAVNTVYRLNEYGPDDLLICCASFEERSLSLVQELGAELPGAFSIIYVIEEPRYQAEIDLISSKCKICFQKKRAEGVYVIRCQRMIPWKG